MEIKSCITDKPIEKNSDDKLKMSRYSNVLSNFIKPRDYIKCKPIQYCFFN
jgi:hypothetical protein